MKSTSNLHYKNDGERPGERRNKMEITREMKLLREYVNGISSSMEKTPQEISRRAVILSLLLGLISTKDLTDD